MTQFALLYSNTRKKFRPNEKTQGYLDRIKALANGSFKTKEEDESTNGAFKTEEEDESTNGTFKTPEDEQTNDTKVQKIFEEAVNDEETGLLHSYSMIVARRAQKRHYDHEEEWLKVKDFARAVGMDRVNFGKSLLAIRRDKETMPLHLLTTTVREEQLHVEHRNDLFGLGKTSMEDEARWGDESYYKKWNWTNMWLDTAKNNWAKGVSGVVGWNWDATRKMWTPQSEKDRALVEECTEKLDLYKYED